MINMKGLLATVLIDAYEYIKVETLNVPGDYLQKDLPKDKFAILLLEGIFLYIMYDINTN